MDVNKKTQCIQSLMSAKIVAIIRVDDRTVLVDIVRALARGGIKAVEITLNTPGALESISAAAAEMGEDVIIGAGTVLGPENARKAIAAGACFILSPVFQPAVVDVCNELGAVSVPGAFTPSEIYSAWNCGADFVKVFPASVAGPAYIKDILAPFPQIRLAPVGGISRANLADYLKAGASFVGIGGALVNKKLIAEKKWDAISDAARQLAAEAARTPSSCEP